MSSTVSFKDIKLFKKIKLDLIGQIVSIGTIVLEFSDTHTHSSILFLKTTQM